MMRRRDALLGAMLATGGLLALSVRPDLQLATQSQADLDIILARPLAGWRSQKPSAVITGSADELGAASYSQLAVRAFEPAKGPIITVLLAYGMAQTYATQLHRPELCYPASGFKVLKQGDVNLNLDDRSIPSRLMIAQRGERQDMVLYWTRVGMRFPTGLWEQRLQIARGVIAGDQNDELLARFSVTGELGPETARLLKAFAASFIEAQTRAGRALLLAAS
jgi:EpsI family protein